MKGLWRTMGGLVIAAAARIWFMSAGTHRSPVANSAAGPALISLLIVAAILFYGCTGKKPEDQGDSNQTSSGASGDRTAVIEPSRDLNQVSPAEEMPALTPDSPPEVVCRQFLDLLRAGKRSEAEQLLTRQALFETRKARLELYLPGSDLATHRVGPAYYSSWKRELAQIEAIFTDRDEAGKAFEQSLTWMLKHQDVGWKIFGLMVSGPDNHGPDLLSLENPVDVECIKNWTAGGGGSADGVPAPVRQALAENPGDGQHN